MKMPDAETREWMLKRFAGFLILTGISLYLVTFIQVSNNLEVLNQAGNVTYMIETSEESKEAISLAFGDFMLYEMFYKPVWYSALGGGILYYLIPEFVYPIFSGAWAFAKRMARRIRE